MHFSKTPKLFLNSNPNPLYSSFSYFDRLPNELTTQILTLLPVKPLVRCRFVCKKWKYIIDDPEFIDLHFNRSIEASSSSSAGNYNKATTFLFLPSHCDEIYVVDKKKDDFFSSSSTKFTTSMKMELPFCLGSIGSFSKLFEKGIFCFTSRLSYNVYSSYICNPFTRQCIKLPRFNETRARMYILVPGFGLDLSSKEFKVVMLFTDCEKPVGGGFRTEVQVFTVGTDSWRTLKNTPNAFCSQNSTVVVNGFVHWFTDEKQILSFDLSSEKFGFIDCPAGDFKGCLMSLDGCLCITDSYADHIEVWIMKKYGVRESWINLIIITRYEFQGSWHTMHTKRPVSFWKDDEILLVADSGTLVSYNFISGGYTLHHIEGLPDEYYDVHPYYGNLLSLEPAG